MQNWIDGNGCISRQETAYLECGADLVSAAGLEDNPWLEAFVEDCRLAFRKYSATTTAARHDISRDPNVHIFTTSSVRRVVRILLAPFITALLLTPVFICNFVGSLTARIVLVAVATTVFVAVLSSFTRARTVELIVAGATYVFYSSSHV